ncbi:hypothetical protein ROZALSC1DRAFT_30609 [Rozella allomycis CSF55]|uniref:Uncharacterized protein n=1 Tax=Rozella allomycis (strain CSF55) TaxID=988480 RepID=A0A075AWL5_ROZAC|nr:hypothetical protein O9G_001919 [Rozella allomycis CSF55]RKP17609.1 hypothetical protein ROZALSC1DRAFT_30609 [Rozella allomycis CSF55]|eukprot:EPZ34617.1 hypothetical protein O9G_001919 [Rozella allomycis CSF55]
MTAPRPGNPSHLIDTIQSYLKEFPDDSNHPLFKRMKMIVFTHFSFHETYFKAKNLLKDNKKANEFLKWVQLDGDTYNQRLHFSKAIALASNSFDSRYIALIEDDFPLCEGKWSTFMRALYQLQLESPDHCSLFIGTGGRQTIANTLSNLLVNESNYPTDVILQKCLRGHFQECSSCKMVATKTLLMYHVGYNTSTMNSRLYGQEQFQCGWRHPFNGELDVRIV